MSDMPFRIGSKVRVIGYPTPSDPYNGFDYNGKVGEIKQAYRVGRGLNDRAVYAYDVYFKDVAVPSAVRDNESGRLIRSVKTSDALNQFEESYLQAAE